MVDRHLKSTASATKKIYGPRTIIERGSRLYPSMLEEVKDPPQKLYVVGNVDALAPGLAVIGARRATPYGLGCAKKFASYAASRGISIISGGAYGCDSEAHRAALRAGGTTVVFLGGGIDKPYPAQHVGLFQQIVDFHGAIVSEHPWTYPAKPYTFRLRNRLIAGLARATLIVEAGMPSGTFSTADDALDMGREVFVVPGSITSPTSQGSNRLLCQGATPIVDEETFDMALGAMFGFLRQETVADAMESILDRMTKLPLDAYWLLRALRADPMRLAEIAQVTYQDEVLGASRASALISLLEAEGEVTRFPDGRYGPAYV